MLFSVANQNYEKHVVVPDLHGEDELLGRVIDYYFDDSEICFVFLGDLVDKRYAKKHDRGVKKTVELVKNLGERAVLTIANHEWSTLATLYDNDTNRRDSHIWSNNNFYGGQSTLLSYGVDLNSLDANADLKTNLEALGHDRVFLDATPYYETDKFIAVHAGVEQDWNWDEQKEYLVKVAREMSRGIYELQPSPWFSTELATDTREVSSTDKIVVSGHAHCLTSSLGKYNYPVKTSELRVINNGKRIRLASLLNNSSCTPLYVWQDWNNEVVAYNRD